MVDRDFYWIQEKPPNTWAKLASGDEFPLPYGLFRLIGHLASVGSQCTSNRVAQHNVINCENDENAFIVASGISAD